MPETCRAIKIAPYKTTATCTKGGQVGSVCEFGCEDDYSLKGVSKIACLDRGKGPFWSADMPLCVGKIYMTKRVATFTLNVRRCDFPILPQGLSFFFAENSVTVGRAVSLPEARLLLSCLRRSSRGGYNMTLRAY